MDADSKSAIDPAQAFQTSRVIHFAVASAPVLFALVAWFAVDGGSEATSGQPQRWTYIWGAGLLGGLLTWGLFRKQVRDLLADPSRSDSEKSGGIPDLHTKVIVSWAGAEIVGLTGGVTYVVTGNQRQLWMALALSVGLFAISYPQRQWFETLKKER